MNTLIEELTDSFLDLEDFQAERALQHAALDAMDRARRCGTGFVITDSGGVRSLSPEETEPYRRRGLENLDRINRKIADLEAPAALALNDRKLNSK